jgi:hypothetical protein
MVVPRSADLELSGMTTKARHVDAIIINSSSSKRMRDNDRAARRDNDEESPAAEGIIKLSL